MKAWLLFDRLYCETHLRSWVTVQGKNGTSSQTKNKLPKKFQQCYLRKESRNTSSFGLAFHVLISKVQCFPLYHIKIFSYCCPALSLFSLFIQSPPFLFSLICRLAETHCWSHTGPLSVWDLLKRFDTFCI